MSACVLEGTPGRGQFAQHRVNQRLGLPLCDAWEPHRLSKEEVMCLGVMIIQRLASGLVDKISRLGLTLDFQ